MIERRNPVPEGVYWVDVFGDQIPGFTAWLTRNAAAVKVRASETVAAGGPLDGTPASQWVLFEVVRPVRWEGPGLPTVAPPNVKSKSDTAQEEFLITLEANGDSGTMRLAWGETAWIAEFTLAQ